MSNVIIWPSFAGRARAGLKQILFYGVGLLWVMIRQWTVRKCGRFYHGAVVSDNQKRDFFIQKCQTCFPWRWRDRNVQWTCVKRGRAAPSHRHSSRAPATPLWACGATPCGEFCFFGIRGVWTMPRELGHNGHDYIRFQIIRTYFLSEVQISFKYRHFYRISDTSDGRFDLKRSDISDYCNSWLRQVE